MKFTIDFKPAALRQLKKISLNSQKRVLQKINSLAENPLPDGVKKMADGASLIRVRVGDYRIVYIIENEQLIVLIVAVGHRREIYRR